MAKKVLHLVYQAIFFRNKWIVSLMFDLFLNKYAIWFHLVNWSNFHIAFLISGAKSVIFHKTSKFMKKSA